MKALEAGRRGRSQELLTHGKKCFGHTKFLFKPCSNRVRFWIDDRDPWGSCAFYECGLEQFLRPKIRNRKRVANQADGFGLHKCILCPFPKFRIEVSEIIVLFVPDRWNYQGHRDESAITGNTISQVRSRLTRPYKGPSRAFCPLSSGDIG